jgi:hypothetical protein
MIKPAMAKPEGWKAWKSHEFSNGPPVHRRMEEQYVQEHILTGWYCRKAAGRRGFALNSFAAHWNDAAFSMSYIQARIAAALLICQV